MSLSPPSRAGTGFILPRGDRGHVRPSETLYWPGPGKLSTVLLLSGAPEIVVAGYWTFVTVSLGSYDPGPGNQLSEFLEIFSPIVKARVFTMGLPSYCPGPGISL